MPFVSRADICEVALFSDRVNCLVILQRSRGGMAHCPWAIGRLLLSFVHRDLHLVLDDAVYVDKEC